MKKLVHISTYRDGGSKSYVGENKEEYWLNNKFGGDPLNGKLLLGSIHNKPPYKLAIGTFQLKDRTGDINIIKQ